MHKQYLLKALNLALMGRGHCSPNPSVGAVAVCDGKIIAQAWHQGAGSPHAERLVLEQLPQNITDVTLYVTLEPCNHWGKTPPCVDAIIARGIKTVVYGKKDPNPLVVANDSPNMLKSHGIEVVYYPLQALDAFYESYEHWLLTKLPWVTAKLAITFDGKIAGPNGQRIAISNQLCSEFTHAQRLNTDVILTTERTISLDDPLLNVRLGERIEGKTIAILDAGLKMKSTAKVMLNAKHIHVYYSETQPTPHVTDAKISYHPMPTNKGLLDVSAVLESLGGLGFHDVWVEAGARLLETLHQENLVNRTHFFLVPKVLGRDGVDAFLSDAIFHRRYDVKWQTMGDNMLASFDWRTDKGTVACSQE